VTETQSPRCTLLSMSGGDLYVRDNAVFKFGDCASSFTSFANGYIEFSGNSKLVYSGAKTSLSGLFIGTGTDTDNMSTEVVFKDHARSQQTNFSEPGSIRIANRKRGTWSTLRIQTDGVVSLGMLTYVGVASKGNSWKGGATLDISNGYAQSGGNCGLIVAYASGASFDQVCTGIVNIAGGAVVSRSNFGGNTGFNNFLGTLVGRGAAVQGSSFVAHGEFNVSGGVFTNQFGYFAVGTGRAKARVMQTGGSIFSVPFQARPILVGFAGGDGSYTVSNGLTQATCDMYVGGADPSTACAGVTWRSGSVDWNATEGDTEDYALGGAVGRLVVSAADKTQGCKVQLSETKSGNPGHLHVGERGTGLVEIGEGGFVVCNGANFAGETSTLKIDLGSSAQYEVNNAASTAFLRVKGELTVGSGARLVVDARRYDGSKKLVRIVRPNSRVGSFAPEDITILGGGEVVQNRDGYSDGSIWYRRAKRGAMLIFR